MSGKRYYLFDWDDNILHMPTKIYLQKYIASKWVDIIIGSKEFAKIREHIGSNYRLTPDSFKDFSSNINFLKDAKSALQSKSFGPSFEKFKESLIYGNDFAIITARSHSPETIKNGVKLLIKYTFTSGELSKMKKSLGGQKISDYLNDQEYHGVSSEDFKKRYGLTGTASNPEKSKKMVIKNYIKEIVDSVPKLINGDYEKMSVGFSDDDLGNVKIIENLIKDELLKLYPHIHFVVYDTSDPKNINKNRIFIKKV